MHGDSVFAQCSTDFELILIDLNQSVVLFEIDQELQPVHSPELSACISISWSIRHFGSPPIQTFRDLLRFEVPETRVNQWIFLLGVRAHLVKLNTISVSVVPDHLNEL